MASSWWDQDDEAKIRELRDVHKAQESGGCWPFWVACAIAYAGGAYGLGYAIEQWTR